MEATMQRIDTHISELEKVSDMCQDKNQAAYQRIKECMDKAYELLEQNPSEDISDKVARSLVDLKKSIDYFTEQHKFYAALESSVNSRAKTMRATKRYLKASNN